MTLNENIKIKGAIDCPFCHNVSLFKKGHFSVSIVPRVHLYLQTLCNKQQNLRLVQFESFADDEKCSKNLGCLWKVEDILGKEENADYLHFSLNILSTHSLIHHFETVSNSNKLHMTTEMWLCKDLRYRLHRKHCGKRWNCSFWAISPFFSLQCFPNVFFFTVLKWVYMEEGLKTFS